jgi:hypothetical protein
MFANISITAVVTITALLLLAELQEFWLDRTRLGNVTMTGATVIVLAWFATGLWQLWTQ